MDDEEIALANEYSVEYNKAMGQPIDFNSDLPIPSFRDLKDRIRPYQEELGGTETCIHMPTEASGPATHYDAKLMPNNTKHNPSDIPSTANTGAQPTANSDIQPRASTDVQPTANTGVQPRANTDVQPGANTGVQPRTSTVIQPRTNTVVQPSVNTELQRSVNPYAELRINTLDF